MGLNTRCPHRRAGAGGIDRDPLHIRRAGAGGIDRDPFHIRRAGAGGTDRELLPEA